MSGLTLVTTPIGNLGDLTERAKVALTHAQNFLCEDTRNTKNLLSLLGISLEGKNFYAFHDHSSEQSTEKVISELKQNTSYILVSDAGSPMVSDPAYPLVKRAIEEGITVDSCPGVCAPILALELSGLPTSPFTFHGFLGREKRDRRAFFSEISLLPGTHIFFEGASRVEESVEEMATAFPEAPMAIGRELTKKFQSIYRFKGSEYQTIKADMIFKGEFVVMIFIGAKKAKTFNEDEIIKLSEDILKEGNKPKIVAKLLSEILSRPTKEIYEHLQGSK